MASSLRRFAMVNCNNSTYLLSLCLRSLGWNVTQFKGPACKICNVINVESLRNSHSCVFCVLIIRHVFVFCSRSSHIGMATWLQNSVPCTACTGSVHSASLQQPRTRQRGLWSVHVGLHFKIKVPIHSEFLPATLLTWFCWEYPAVFVCLCRCKGRVLVFTTCFDQQEN